MHAQSLFRYILNIRSDQDTVLVWATAGSEDPVTFRSGGQLLWILIFFKKWNKKLPAL